MTEESSKKRFSFFKKKPKLLQETAFDDTTFNFDLKGGPYNTSLIEASATVKDGPNAEMPLPLKCTWYRATSEKEFVEIDGVQGAFYQSNADDIGCRICVHAVPVSEVEEYTGMPAFSEVGPLEIDPEVESNVQSMLKSDSGEFLVTLKSSEGVTGVKGERFKLRINNQQFLVEDEENNTVTEHQIDSQYPKVSIHYKTNTGFSLEFPSCKFEFEAETPPQRDTITIAIRTFCGKNLVGDSANSFLKIEQLTSRVDSLNLEYSFVLTKLKTTKEQLENSKTDLKELQEKFEVLQKENEETREQYFCMNDKIEKYENELKFLRQDLKVFKNQNTSLEKKLEETQNLKEEFLELLSGINQVKEGFKSYELCSSCRVFEVQLGELLSNYLCHLPEDTSKSSSAHSTQTNATDVESDDCKSQELSDCKETIEVLKAQLVKAKQEKSEITNRVEAEKNFYKRKIESLVSENDKLLSKLGKNPKQNSLLEQENEDLKNENQNTKREMDSVKEKCKLLERLLEINKNKLDSEKRNNFEMRKTLETRQSKYSNSDFQRIINSMTQTITEREEELQTQKKINRELLSRVSQLES